MLVKFSCDCIGYRLSVPGTQEVRCWVIECCDGTYENASPAIWEREGLVEKTYEPLKPHDVERLMKRLGSFVDKGHRFDSIQAALRPPPPELQP